MPEFDEELLKKLYDFVKYARETIRPLIEDHIEKIPHTQERKSFELEEFSKVIDVLTKNWTIHIIWELEVHDGLNFNEIFRHLPGISTKSLSGALKKLEEFDLITRTVQDTRPPKVFYELNDRGKGFIDLSLPIIFHLMKL